VRSDGKLARFLLPFYLMGGNGYSKNTGIKLLVEKYRKKFRIAENINHYSEENYKIAERKFLKFALGMGDSKDHTK
jgi:hypothetical protein